MNIIPLYDTMYEQILSAAGIGDFVVSPRYSKDNASIIVYPKEPGNLERSVLAIYKTSDTIEFSLILGCFTIPGTLAGTKRKINPLWNNTLKLFSEAPDWIKIDKWGVDIQKMTKWYFTADHSLPLDGNVNVTLQNIAGDMVKLLIDINNHSKSNDVFRKLFTITAGQA